MRGWGLCLLVMGIAGPGAGRAVASDEAVRRDWHFRESLAAIRDWEAILARWESATPKADRTPVLAVPPDGHAVAWPNPFPRTLLPDDDVARRVRVSLVNKKVIVQRSGPDGKDVRETASPGKSVVGYKHPGGGGKDHWYHAYHRRFDRMATFVPRPAPFAVSVDTPLDLKRGDNEVVVTVRNHGAASAAMAVSLELHTTKRRTACGSRNVDVPGKRQVPLRFRVDLDEPGGGMLIVKVGGGGVVSWWPIFTHIEDVEAVLKSVGQILADTPDQEAARRLDGLRRQVDRWDADRARADRVPWRTLFERAGALRDELLLDRIDFETLLFVKRKPYDSEQPFMDAHHLRNPPGGGIYRLSPVRPDGAVTPVVDTLGDGVYRDVHLHWDADRFVFAFGNGSDKWDGGQSYDIYEMVLHSAAPRRLTSGPKNDCEPFYLPTGQIGFTSDRPEHYVMCGGNRHSPLLHVMESDGSGVRQLSFNVFNDFNPTVMPNGQILYSRWEYNERSVTSLHNPFTVNPDGTMVSPYYGNATIRPNVVMFPRPVPDSTKIMALFTAHHGQTHGAVGVIDIGRGVDGDEPLTVLTPDIPVTAEKALDSRHGWYSDPVPLSEDTYLCSYTPTVVPWLPRSWALYVGDRHGNLGLIYRDPEISCCEPVPLVRRRRPHPRPPAPPDTAATDAEAELILLDVHVGLEGVPREVARYLRIVEDVPRKSVHEGGVICTSGTLIFTIKRILGTVPIEADGSAYFVVPANRNVYFEALDEDGLEIQRMRSVVCLKPNETRTCVGCHESRTSSPPNRPAGALSRSPSRPSPPPWGTRTVSYLRDVQPILNAKCVRCHTHDRTANRVILTDDLTQQFVVGYEELLDHITVAISNRWDHPDDVHARPPYTYGSKVSRLTKMLAAGHHDVTLSEDERLRLVNWIDANGVYYDRYETPHWPNRRLFTGQRRKTMDAVYARRCASCHGKNDGRKATWWLSLNRRNPALSRALQAPLARSAGGWGRCAPAVFANRNDVDYRMLLAQLTGVRDRLANHPREDVLSLRGTSAERQQVAIPPAPPPRPPADAALTDGRCVFLSDLPWASATAGWSRNKDGLPRIDRDITEGRLRLAGQWYHKGIGTHAPSEITYPLKGKYARLQATVGGAEAGGTIVFQVYGDGKRLYDSGVMRGLQGAKPLDVPVDGVRQLRLVVTDAGNGYVADCANWAAARLIPSAH